MSSLIFDKAGNLYGTTYLGGAYGDGTVFELRPTESGWNETVLHDFGQGQDGLFPVSGLVMNGSGHLYGTTWSGGESDSGTVFELSLSKGKWSEKIIYSSSSCGSPYGIYAGLAVDGHRNIFGVSAGCNNAFELQPNGKGGWNSTVLHTFALTKRDGNYPYGTPVLDDKGNLYGTTEMGGSHAIGTVWKLTQGKNKWTEKILYSFKGGTEDGAYAQAGVVLDALGNIYGASKAQEGFGDVYELAVDDSTYKESIVWTFNGSDGNDPIGGLLLRDGTLYGTTFWGGSGFYGECGYDITGCGVVFELTP
jgi:uncharacterized repeat protein (TIGR03803 family)